MGGQPIRIVTHCQPPNRRAAGGVITAAARAPSAPAAATGSSPVTEAWVSAA